MTARTLATRAAAAARGAAAGGGPAKLISIVIPVLDEEQALPACLESVNGQEPPFEVIVVDGGSRDQSRRLAAAAGARVLEVAPPGRGRQMNHGAAASSGEILLFLHADTRLPSGALARLRAGHVASEGEMAGAFTMTFDNSGAAYRLVCWLADNYCRLTGDLFGDRGMFITRRLFERLGGFSTLPLMEDMELSRRLRLAGCRPVILPGPVVTSARRAEQLGLGPVAAAAARLIFAFHFRRGRTLDPRPAGVFARICRRPGPGARPVTEQEAEALVNE